MPRIVAPCRSFVIQQYTWLTVIVSVAPSPPLLLTWPLISPYVVGNPSRAILCREASHHRKKPSSNVYVYAYVYVAGAIRQFVNEARGRGRERAGRYIHVVHMREGKGGGGRRGKAGGTGGGTPNKIPAAVVGGGGGSGERDDGYGMLNRLSMRHARGWMEEKVIIFMLQER